MTIQYKNAPFNLTTTNLTTVLTIAADSRAIVKGFNMTNEHNNNVLVEGFVHDSSESTEFEFFHKLLSSDSTEKDACGQALVLEESDSIKMRAATASTVQGVISYSLINRSQENG